jgi:hypothetical protein
MNDYEKQYLYFSLEENLLGLPAFPLVLSDDLVVFVHRLLGDGALNWNIEYSNDELIQEKERIVAMGIPESEFFTMKTLLELLEQFEKGSNE